MKTHNLIHYQKGRYGDVDGADFLQWQRGQSPDPLSQSDLADWQGNYGTAVSQSTNNQAVPEPGALALLGLGGAFLLGRRRRLSALPVS